MVSSCFILPSFLTNNCDLTAAPQSSHWHQFASSRDSVCFCMFPFSFFVASVTIHGCSFATITTLFCSHWFLPHLYRSPQSLCRRAVSHTLPRLLLRICINHGLVAVLYLYDALLMPPPSMTLTVTTSKANVTLLLGPSHWPLALYWLCRCATIVLFTLGILNVPPCLANPRYNLFFYHNLQVFTCLIQTFISRTEIGTIHYFFPFCFTTFWILFAVVFCCLSNQIRNVVR